jgi:F-type H+-transporting ATPase subunit b
MKRLNFALAALLAAPAFAQEHGGGEPNVFAGDIGNAIWTVVIFLLVVLVLGKYAWGPILKQLQAREDFIRESLEKAKRDRDEAEARLKEYESRIANARAEATAIVDEGRRDAEAVKRTIEEAARGETEKMVTRAKHEIQLATDTATKDLYNLSARLATDIAAKILGREISAQDHERLISESLASLDAGPRN